MSKLQVQEVFFVFKLQVKIPYETWIKDGRFKTDRTVKF